VIVVNPVPTLDPFPQAPGHERLGNLERLVGMAKSSDHGIRQEPISEVFVCVEEAHGIKPERYSRPVFADQVSRNEDLTMVKECVV
jgi:hypothetical protein